MHAPMLCYVPISPSNLDGNPPHPCSPSPWAATHPGLQPASTGRPVSASPGAQERAVCPENLSPRTNRAKIRDSPSQGLELGLLGPSINAALSSTAPRFVQQRQRKGGKKVLPCPSKSGQNRFLIKAALNHYRPANAGLVDI